MCCYLSANKQFVDLAQVNKIEEKERASHYPTQVLIDVLDDLDGEFDMDVSLPEVFSSSILDEEWLEQEAERVVNVMANERRARDVLIHPSIECQDVSGDINYM